MRDKIIAYSDQVIFLFLCILVFFAGFSKAAIEISFSVAFLAFMVGLVAKRDWRHIVPSTELNLPILCFVSVGAISLISLINTPLLKKGLHALFFKTGEYIIIYFLIIKTVNTKKRLKVILAILLFSSAVVGLSGVYQQFRGIDFLRHRPLLENRMTASFDHYNNFGGYLTLLLPLTLTLALSNKMRTVYRIGAAILTFLLAFCLLSTYSRGAWVGVFIGLIFIFTHKIFNMSTRRRKILTALLIIIFLVGIYSMLPISAKQRAISIVEINTAGRLGSNGFWMQAIELVKQRPLFGQGLGIYMDKTHGFYAHNCYLQMAAEIGLAGLMCFLWMVGVLFWIGIKTLKKSEDPAFLGMLAGILSFLCHSFFDNNLYSLQQVTLFWVMVGLAMSLYHIINNKVIAKL